MKIFDWLREYFDKIRSYFRKKKQEGAVRDLLTTNGMSQQEIESIIEERVGKEEIITIEQILELAQKKTVTDLQGIIASPQKKYKRIFDIIQIEQEVTTLNEKLIAIQIKQKQIESVRFPKNYTTDKDVEELGRILQKYNNKQNLTLSTSAIDKLKNRFVQFDKFLEERLLVRKYQLREAERVKEFKKFKNEIETLHIQVNKQIEQDDFQSAKLALRELEILLKSIQARSVKIVQGKMNNRIVSSLISKTAELKRKLSFREIEVEAKRQAEELKRKQEEAERRRLVEESKREEERQLSELAKNIRRQEEEAIRKKEYERAQTLQRLLTKKTNWEDFAQVLQANGITTLYHFTDRANIDYIKLHGGLFSWQHLRKVGIEVPYEGGGSLSKDLDRRYGLEDFVRVSFTENHPMMYVARDEKRIPNPVILKINTIVCQLQNTKFANMNATRNGHNCGNSLTDLQRVKFEVVSQRNHFDLSEQDKPYYQAEVLVKTWIPIEFITNIDQF